MTSIINPIVHNTIADSMFKDSIIKSSRYYYFLGKTLPYNSGVEVLETPTDDYSYELSTRREIIELKQITPNDISYVIPRYDWVYNTVYAQYDDIINISQLKFYVLTSDYNVYKCLDNNYGAASTIMPTGTDSDPFITADGYKWKFMMTLPLSLRNKFLTTSYIPVTTAIKSSFYNNNGIDNVEILNGGTGYSTLELTTLSITSVSGTDAVIIPTIESGVITYVTVVNGGTNYSTSDDIVITSTTGSGADLYLKVVDGVVTDVFVLNGGSNYPSNYTTTLSVESNTGTGAKLIPIVVDGAIVDVIIDNPGYGYTYANVTPSGNGPLDTDAIINVIVNGGALDTIQSNVELLAIDGAIDCIKLTNFGTNYGYATVTIDGDGYGCTAEAILDETSHISKINITSRGYGYTYATVTINGNGTGATARAIMSPKGGHGKDAVTELYADSLMFYCNISTERNNGFVIENDYRQIGIIKNPIQYNSTSYFNDRFGSTCYALTGTVNLSKFPLDTKLTDNNGHKYTIVAAKTTGLLVQAYDNEPPVIGMNLTNQNNGEVFSFTAITNPQVDKYSGKMLYIDNRDPFFQTADQSISFQTIIKF